MIAGNLNYQAVTTEIVALKKADDMQPGSSPKSSIFVAKAVTVLLKVVKYGYCGFYANDFLFASLYGYGSQIHNQVLTCICCHSLSNMWQDKGNHLHRNRNIRILQRR